MRNSPYASRAFALIHCLFVSRLAPQAVKPSPPPGGLRRGATLSGLLVVVTLAMFSGVRQLVFPGRPSEPAALASVFAMQSVPLPSSERKRSIERLKERLVRYAARHSGKFPATRREVAAPDNPWILPGQEGKRYGYVPELSLDGDTAILAYEPEVFEDPGYVLLSNGSIAQMNYSEIRRMLAQQDPP